VVDKRPETDATTFEHQQYLAMRWDASAGMNFKEYTDIRLEALRLVGGGNVTGFFSVAAFMATGAKTAASLLAAKICLSIFSVGIVAFGLAYWYMYGWRSSLDNALALFSKIKTFDHPTIRESLQEAARVFHLGGGFSLLALLCLCVASATALLGMLLLY
jgi:hypothetical protein